MSERAEHLGRDLAQGVDTRALRDEAGDDSLGSNLEEAVKSFFIEFNENNDDIQNELVDLAATQLAQSEYSSTVTRDGLVSQSKSLARDALYGYLSELLSDEFDIGYENIPRAETMFDFRDGIIESGMNTAEDLQ